ncbi:MAG: polysaccharide biosynthesis tyrosine autokinase [Marinilabiliaceae bacterium]|nr:polysaccharide biosynthesis tyrosine autokinase [Marinilabiliaceae bacterium]
MRYWWLFIITLPICWFTVYTIHRYSLPVYRANISLLMEEKGDNMPQANMMEGFGLTPGQSSVENQMAILTSLDVIKRTIDQLDFHVGYYVKGNVKHTEVYGQRPFTVHFDSLHPQLLSTPLNITILSDKKYNLQVISEGASTYTYGTGSNGPSVVIPEFNGDYYFGEQVKTRWGSFTINCNNCNPSLDQDYYFIFNHPYTLAAQYKSRIRTSKANENSSIVHVSLTGKNISKNNRFLNALANVFIATNLAKKNLIATNTIRFIESQLLVISDTLQTTGSQLSQFRTDNRIQSVSAKADYLFSGLQEMEQQLAQLEITRRYYLYLKDYFSNVLESNEVVAPAMYQTDNNLLNEQIRTIMELNSQRLNMKESYSEMLNPAQKELESQINIARETLLKTISSQLLVLNENVVRIQDSKASNESELYHLPETERRLLGIERKFELSNEVYTFLLRKRSEAQIQKASNTPDHQILEAARYSGQISPNTQGDQRKALLIGFIIPLIILALKQLLNNKIINAEDIERITPLPILGQIIHSPKEESNVALHHPKSVVTETFRRLRTRLEFMNSDKACPIIGVTSSMPGEGKTYCALNIAATLAISGKKTALLGFDLRKPGLNKIINSNGHAGLSNYLIGKATIDDIQMESGQKNLTIIPTGDIPPNPAELISSAKTSELLEVLKQQFDHIILDTPPMGIVSDPYLLARHVDSLVFLVRQNHTVKEVMAHTLKNLEDEGITNTGILLNDVQVTKRRGYGYGYGYGYVYGYGHGYYED